ncbi:hypothetical protein Hanom_Chr02g00138731 [Helianthus anomalus]
MTRICSQSSQQDSIEMEDLRNEVIELKEELKQSNIKHKRFDIVLELKVSGFRDHKNVVNEDDGLDALHNESDNIIKEISYRVCYFFLSNTFLNCRIDQMMLS